MTASSEIKGIQVNIILELKVNNSTKYLFDDLKVTPLGTEGISTRYFGYLYASQIPVFLSGQDIFSRMRLLEGQMIFGNPFTGIQKISI